MKPELTAMIARAAQLRAQALAPAPRASLLQEIEDALCDGYLQALEGDAWSARTGERLEELRRAAAQSGGASGLHALAREHSDFVRHLAALRDTLEALRVEHEAMCLQARDVSRST